MMEGAREDSARFIPIPKLAIFADLQRSRAILASLKVSPAQIKIADDARSGPHGFSLQQLAQLADDTGLKFKLIYRKPGQPIPVPSIINWKIHHYAAIVDTRDGLYQLQDSTFGGHGGRLSQPRRLMLRAAVIFWFRPLSLRPSTVPDCARLTHSPPKLRQSMGWVMYSTSRLAW